MDDFRNALDEGKRLCHDFMTNEDSAEFGCTMPDVPGFGEALTNIAMFGGYPDCGVYDDDYDSNDPENNDDGGPVHSRPRLTPGSANYVEESPSERPEVIT